MNPLNPVPDPAAQLAHLGAALSATAEVAAMIDLTEQDHADRFPNLGHTEAGRVLLEMRPDLEAFAVEIAVSIDRVAAGEVFPVDVATIAEDSEDRIRSVRGMLDIACAEIREG